MILFFSLGPPGVEKINQNRILACLVDGGGGDKFAFAKHRTRVALLIKAR